jgi:hypothetical protein
VHSTEEVALYAVLLREAARNHHTSAQALLDDFESCRDQVCFATMLAHQHFTELDWQLVELLIDHPGEVFEAAHVLYGEHEQPLEAEALLHACGPNGKKSRGVWFEPFRERWDRVRIGIRAYEGEGIVLTLLDLDAIAKDTFMARTDITEAAYWEEFVEPQIEAELAEPQVDLERAFKPLCPYGPGTVGWERWHKQRKQLDEINTMKVD